MKFKIIETKEGGFAPLIKESGWFKPWKYIYRWKFRGEYTFATTMTCLDSVPKKTIKECLNVIDTYQEWLNNG